VGRVGNLRPIVNRPTTATVCPTIHGIIGIVAQQDEWVTVRQLPDGEAHSGRLESGAGRRLQIAIPSTAKRAEFKPGAPVEVQSDRTLYLGAVLTRQDSVMSVAIEHTLDRTALAEIQEVWHGSVRA
jgi:hypothetical protein